ncbi:hypothetical protein HD553DRAFT_323745 [Filobasidium floriforme]|uniref:uncharacterized protein n=1 Tax=Filobasidium floriforme TaxID=5210 RepID=UPI001E8D3A61|nr:uncharacterized protein HD553DRAFT_323745 [Filobasidium floriforme]KAH8085166.1 hypothetical protein HD553DRAFT_323745 [Filobasidium floriforme]
MQYNRSLTLNSQSDEITQRSSINTSHSIHHPYASPGPASEHMPGEEEMGPHADRLVQRMMSEVLSGTDGTELPDCLAGRSSQDESQSLSPVAPSFAPATVSTYRSSKLSADDVHQCSRTGSRLLDGKCRSNDESRGSASREPFDAFHDCPDLQSRSPKIAYVPAPRVEAYSVVGLSERRPSIVAVAGHGQGYRTSRLVILQMASPLSESAKDRRNDYSLEADNFRRHFPRAFQSIAVI